MFSGLFSQPWKRLNVRLALWYSVLFLATVASVLVFGYFALRSRMAEQDRDVIVFRLSQFSTEYAQRGMSGVISLAAWRVGRAQKAFFVRVATLENRTLFIRDADDWADFYPQQLESRSLLPSKDISWVSLWSPPGYELLIAENLLPDGTIVQVGKALEESVELLRQFRTVSLGVLAFCVPLSFLGGAILAARVLRPLRDLTSTVREIQQTARFSARTPESGSGDELDELARVFNAAMSQIESLLSTMRESLDNVAHDLRTPMTRLRNRAQACLEECQDPGGFREALAECVEESETVLQMLNTIMDIAEAEAGLVKIAPAPVDVAELVGAIRDLYQEVAEDKRVVLNESVSEGLLVRGDPILLRRVLANMLDNAIKYTAEGGRVDFSALACGEEVSISLTDSGRGISPGDLPKVWDRLFRGDRSRSERGLGLGLSFVKAIVEAHGGEVAAASEPGRGSKFSVTLPAWKEEPGIARRGL